MNRKTREVDMEAKLHSKMDVRTGDPVLDHLLRTLFFYMEIPVEVTVRSWDLKHHLWEDMGILIGRLLRNEFVENRNIARFGNCIIPMDDALVVVSVDVSSRPFLNFDVDFVEKEEGFELALMREFLMGLTRGLGMTLHVKKMAGSNAHHLSEAVFKGLGKALKEALGESKRLESTKGEL